MDTKINYVAVGIFVSILLVGFFAIILWLTVGTTRANYNLYLTYMSESVSGLNIQSPVKYNGVNVGFVKAINLDVQNPQQVKVLLAIDDSIPIHEDTTARVESQGLTGIAYIGLRGGAPSSPLVHKQAGNKYPIIVSSPSLLLQLDSTIRNLSVNLNKITKDLQGVLSEKNQVSIQTMLNNMSTVTSMLAANSDKLNNSIDHLNITLNNTALASQQLPQLMQSTQQSLTTITQTAEQIKQAGAEVNMTMRHGRLAMDSVINQLLPQTYKTLQSMTALSNNLQILSTDVKDNPSILIRGKQPAPLGPGEK